MTPAKACIGTYRESWIAGSRCTYKRMGAAVTAILAGVPSGTGHERCCSRTQPYHTGLSSSRDLDVTPKPQKAVRCGHSLRLCVRLSFDEFAIEEAKMTGECGIATITQSARLYTLRLSHLAIITPRWSPITNTRQKCIDTQVDIITVTENHAISSQLLRATH